MLQSLNPDTVPAGSGNLTLTVNGSNFFQGSTIKLNGDSRPTDFISTSVLKGTILAADLATARSIGISVSNPGSADSNQLTLTVNNPAPKLASVSPNSVKAGSAAFSLTVTGSDFIQGSTGSEVLWNNSTRMTHFVSSITLTADILASDIHQAGAQLPCALPKPGGGTSSTST